MWFVGSGWLALVGGCRSGIALTVSPAEPRTDDVLTAVLVTRADPSSITWRWQVDGDDTDVHGPIVGPAETGRGQRWRVVASVKHGGETQQFDAIVVIGDTPPVADGVTVSPDPARPGEPLTAVLDATDADEDPLSVGYVWLKDGVDTVYTGPSVPPGVTRGGESWSVTATVSAEGATAPAVQGSVDVVNGAPIVDSVSVSPASPVVTDALVGSASVHDPDRDGTSLRWRWLVDGVEVDGYQTDTLPASLAAKGSAVVAEVTATDTYGASTVVASDPVVVANSVPAITSVEVQPSPLAASDEPRCVPIGWVDPDGDPPQFTFAWEIDGAAGPATELLPRQPDGTEVRCTATPVDDASVGAPLTSDLAVVHNGRPYGGTMTVEPASPVFGVDDLRCVYGDPPVDPEGDPFTVAIGWTRDGAPWAGETATTDAPGDTLPPWVASTGRTWTCEALATDAGGTGVGAAVDVTPAPAETNVLVLLADDVGVDKIGAYGVHPSPAITPTIDALADAGVRFERFWATHGCSPSRAELLTGRYTKRYGVGGIIETLVETNVLPDDEVLIPEMLAYAPSTWDASFTGKWHLTSILAGGGAVDPAIQGFPWHAGSLDNLGVTWTGLADPLGYGRWEKDTNGSLAENLVYATTDTTNDAIARIAAMPEPWLLWVSYNSAHYPIHAPPPDLTTVDADGSSTDLEKYEAMVEALDTSIADLLASIDPDVLARTTIIFMGDNGTSTYGTEPPWDPELAKGTIYEPGVRVPLIVSGPLVTTPGVESPALTVAVDLYDTVAAIAGVVVPEVDAAEGVEARDGVSFLPFVADPFRPTRRRYTYTDKFLPNGPPPYNIDRRAACDGRFKLHRHRNGLRSWEEFYDLQGLPYEGQDLLTTGLPLDAQQQAAYDALSVELDRKEADLVYEY